MRRFADKVAIVTEALWLADGGVTVAKGAVGKQTPEELRLDRYLIFRRQHLIEGAKIALNEDIRPWLSDIKSPCLILWSDRDYFTPIEIGYGLVKAIPNSKLQVVPDVYHEWCMMQPETIAEISFDFFKQVESITQANYESTKA